MATERTRCAPSEAACLRCQAVPEGLDQQQAALLFGAPDVDARATLETELETLGFPILAQGPVLILPEIRAHLAAVSTHLLTHLSPYTQRSVRAAYAPGGLTTAESIFAALLYAEPLSVLLQRIEHEWVRDAFREDWFFSVFHAIVEAAAGQVFAYETLIRARHPETQEVIGAGAIIRACEELNLQHQLDQRARQSAIRHAAALGLPDARFFINFMPNTIYKPEICLRTTMETAAACGMEVDRLVFEVVETEQIPDMAHLHHILDYYRAQGMGTAVDDMGAGFTSTEYLYALRPDYVKLDRDVMVEAEKETKARHKLDVLVNTAHSLDIKVIAEGIETPAQMAICREAGVDYLQGFLFARPANPPQPVAADLFATTNACAPEPMSLPKCA